jgi:hypothetical protein
MRDLTWLRIFDVFSPCTSAISHNTRLGFRFDVQDGENVEMPKCIFHFIDSLGRAYLVSLKLPWLDLNNATVQPIGCRPNVAESRIESSPNSMRQTTRFGEMIG